MWNKVNMWNKVHWTNIGHIPAGVPIYYYYASVSIIQIEMHMSPVMGWKCLGVIRDVKLEHLDSNHNWWKCVGNNINLKLEYVV